MRTHPTSAGRPATQPREAASLRKTLLIGILLPVLLFMAVDSISRYRQSLGAVNTAYDRTLLASAKSIGETLTIEPVPAANPASAGASARASTSAAPPATRLRATVPYAALEAFEADNRSRMVYRVSSVDGALVSGYDALPRYRRTIPAVGAYAALVDFYDDTFEGEPVRVAALMQPVAYGDATGMAVVQVAETLELRQTLATELLIGTIWRQLALLAVIAAVVIAVVHWATEPVRSLGRAIEAREPSDLSPLNSAGAPTELQPLLDAMNHNLARLDTLIADQRRFVRDASHQLRTPLTVLKVQIQSARRGDVSAEVALREIEDTADRTIALANQMLSLARVEQLRKDGAVGQDATPPVCTRLDLAAQDMALELSPLIAAKNLDFSIEVTAAPVNAQAWALRELCRNLIGNAITHTPASGLLKIAVYADARHAALLVSDSGPGIESWRAQAPFAAFAAGERPGSTGLGLAICNDITQALGGSLSLENRLRGAAVVGLDAVARLPLGG